MYFYLMGITEACFYSGRRKGKEGGDGKPGFWGQPTAACPGSLRFWAEPMVPVAALCLLLAESQVQNLLLCQSDVQIDN